MLAKRLLVALVLLPVGMAAILAGGWYLTALVAIFMCLAAWEYVKLFRAMGYNLPAF
jgi:CDP-diglyceride synthetase